MLLLAEYELSDAEREEREVERLMPRDRPRSRKYKEKRGPRYDLRRQRMKIDDPDLGEDTAESDADMSLRSREANLVRIAERISVEEEEPPTERKPPRRPPLERPPPPPGTEPFRGVPPPTKKKEEPKKKKEEPKKISPPRKEIARPDIISKLISSVNDCSNKLREISPAIADAFDEYSKHHILIHPEGKSEKEIIELIAGIQEIGKGLEDKTKKVTNRLQKADSEEALNIIAEYWPENINDWAGKAGVINGIDIAIDKIGIPNSFTTPFKRANIDDSIRDRKLIRDIISSLSGKYLKDFDEEALFKFVQLISALQYLIKNPGIVTPESLAKDVSTLSKIVQEQSHALMELGMIMDTWRSIMSTFRTRGREEPWQLGQSLNRVLSSIDSFFNRRKVVEPSIYMDEFSKYIEREYGEIPEELEGYFGKSKRAATSNEAFRVETMISKIAAYHGIDDLRGNPTDPINTPWRSHDKRYFTEDNYKSILKVAQQYLQEDWLKYGWKDGSDEAPLRAALDLAIYTADNNLYQSKIDAETYEILLNRLAKWGYDTFTETVLPFKKSKRSTTAMSQNIQSILRIASEVRKTDPKKAVEIIANLRSMVSNRAETSVDVKIPASGTAGPEETRAETLKALDRLEIELRREDLEKFLKGIKDIYEQVSTLGKKARTSADIRKLAIVEKLEVLEDMDEASVWKIIKDQEDELKKLEGKAKKTDFSKSEELEDLRKMLDELIGDIVEGAKTASTRVSLSTLIRIAYYHPEVRSELLPIIVTAKKKKTKKLKQQQRGKCVFPYENPKVKDNKDHFPINDENQARNALSRVNQYDKVPSWYDGSLKELVEAVARKVHSEYPDISISEESKSPGKGKKKSKSKRKKATIDQEDMSW